MIRGQGLHPPKYIGELVQLKEQQVYKADLTLFLEANVSKEILDSHGENLKKAFAQSLRASDMEDGD